MSPPKSLDHPSFGKCELIPTIVAIKWRTPLAPDALGSNLKSYSLEAATETPKHKEKLEGETPKRKEKREEAVRDPRFEINNTDVLTWASSKTPLTDAALSKIKDAQNVEYVAPVYRAVNSDPPPVSYFAINPTALLVTADILSAVGDLGSLDESASINEQRTKLMKNFVVINLPNANAIELAQQIQQRAGAAARGFKFENIPYISPSTTCSSCGSSGDHHGRGQHAKCSPALKDLIPNDTFFPNQWGLQRINAPRAWPITQGDPNIVISVLDRGVELAHPDLHLWPISYSVITHLFDGSPIANHGTPCAGIISSHIENATGAAGLAAKCSVLAIASGHTDVQVAEGLYFSADNGARVVSMSFGVYPSWMTWDFTIIEAALQYCHERNVVLVAATGNEDQNVSRFPATDPRTIGIGGSNRDDVRKETGDTSSEPGWGACFGPDVDVVAPCLEIPSTDRLGGLGYTATDYTLGFNGTSAATPHVAALAGLILSVNPALTNLEVRRIISETADKINQPAYVYLPTPGKPFGTWNENVGYGRINVERALLAACAGQEGCKAEGPCGVDIPQPDDCCVSPCDPPWRTDEQCLYWYETRYFKVPLRSDNQPTAADIAALRIYIEFRIIYEHKLCLLGKQHGPLLFTQTLLPGEKVTLYHSDRYRRITSETNRFSVQTTFMQFLSVVHEARMTNTLEFLADRVSSEKGSVSGSVGGGLAGLLGLPSGSASKQTSVTDHNMLKIGLVSDTFNQSVFQASQMTHAERSVVVSNYEEKDVANITARMIQNDNECRAVTYFIRKVVELWAVSTRVAEISYRIVAPNLPTDWHSIEDIGWLPPAIQNQIKAALILMPKVGEYTERPRPISLPTDGTVYDPELAHCCSCEPERAAAIAIRLEKQKAEALKACLEAQKLELELMRRRLLLQRGELGPFTPQPGGKILPAENAPGGE